MVPTVAAPTEQTINQRIVNLVNVQEVARAYRSLVVPGQVVEVRALNATLQTGGRYLETLAGYFDNERSLVSEVSKVVRATGIYITLHPCHPDAIYKACNKLVSGKHIQTTTDKDIIAYSWLAVDCDPKRIAGISSTDEEHERALNLASLIRNELCNLGWPEPILGDSGNGAHLLYKIDLKVFDVSLIKRVLVGLARQFDVPDVVHVDQTLYNPGQIIKLYGTMACKGDNTQKRPHRFSRLLEVPGNIISVSRDLLEQIAVPEQSPATRVTAPVVQSVKEAITAEAFLQKYHIEVRATTPYEGGTRYQLAACVWDSSHTDHSACVFQFADGRLGASCSHNSCKGKGWKDFRLVFEPDAYTKKGKKKESGQTDNTSGGGLVEEKEPSQLELLMNIASCAHLIRTPAHELYARVEVAGHSEVVSIGEKGSGFKRWLVYQFCKLHGFPPSAEPVNQVLTMIQAIAEYEGERARVYTRIAAKDGCVYLDLCNDQWECIEVSSDGWRIITRPPVYFRRPNGMLPLPTPKRGGTLDDLRQIINTKSDTDFQLMTAWLVGALHPHGPYPILGLNGERGSAKTKTTEILRKLLDPNVAPHRNAPKEPRDAAIAAKNNMVIALDNLSSLPRWLSDILCRIATGSGYSTREMYSDDGECIFNDTRPIIINGIEDTLVTEGDLLNRTIMVTLSPPEEYLRAEDIDDIFESLHPGILGALLTAASLALRDRKKVHIDNPPRMVDFACWVTAAEPALGWQPGTFLAAFSENQESGTSIVLDASKVAKTIMLILGHHDGEWVGSVTDLLLELDKYEDYKADKKVPKTANVLSGHLKRIAPTMRTQAIDIQQKRTKNGSRVTISTITTTSKAPAVASVETGQVAALVQETGQSDPMQQALDKAKQLLTFCKKEQVEITYYDDQEQAVIDAPDSFSIQRWQDLIKCEEENRVALRQIIGVIPRPIEEYPIDESEYDHSDLPEHEQEVLITGVTLPEDESVQVLTTELNVQLTPQAQEVYMLYLERMKSSRMRLWRAIDQNMDDGLLTKEKHVEKTRKMLAGSIDEQQAALEVILRLIDQYNGAIPESMLQMDLSHS